jgi:hypothetical protein
MNDKTPIDRKRESGGMSEIGTKDDGAILEMPKIGEKLFIIKEKAIYEFIMADDIDPERTNISLPNNIHKLIINKGADSELVGRTFLTAKTLFKSEFFNPSINLDKALFLTIEILQELSILEKEISDFLNKENELCEDYDSKKNKDISYSIPGFGDAETRLKTIFQKADHIEQILIEIIIIFYPSLGITKQSHLPNFYDAIKAKYGDDDEFTKFLEPIVFFMKTIRAFRNALDHRLGTVKIFDFELQKDSNILAPSFELKHKDVKLERQSISELLKIILPNLIFIFENTLIHMCYKTFTPHLMAQGIKEIPESERKYKYVKYCFWSPLGEGGFYSQ